jgi:diacylglycerol O-acyltransferase / wax synthase
MVESTTQARSPAPVPAPSPAAGSDLASTRPSLGRELAIGLSTFALYLLVDAFGGPARTASARAHGVDLFRLEIRLHLDLEPRANAWLNLHPLLRMLADYEYGSTYILAAFGLLTWLYLRRPEEYRQARSSFVLLNLVAIGCFALYPVMPPRLLPGLVSGHGFIDTVTQGHTVGSWGSPLVSHANQLAAMPSLHVGWALWVSVVLARLSGGRRTQVFSAAHVALTTWVVVATANHYVLDAVGAIVVVAIGVLVARSWGPSGRLGPSVVPAADAFFLHIESPSYPQQVGGVVPLDISGREAASPSRLDVVDLIRDRLAGLPRFRQRLDLPTSRWGRARWRDHDELDWDWHVPLYDLTTPGGRPGGQQALNQLTADLAGTVLPRDRPLWRMVVVHGVELDRSAVILIVHHVIADGIGTVAQALRLLDPPLPKPDLPTVRIGPLRRLLAVIIGLAQLATEGRAASVRDGDTAGDSDRAGDRDGDAGVRRAFVRLSFPLPVVRAAARTANARVSDLLLCAVASGLAHLDLPTLPTLPTRLRVAVPLMVREPGTAAEGNVTAAVMIDLPVQPMPELERLREIARKSRRLRTGSRALASRFVMATVAGWMPTPLHSWFARSVYGPRYFHGIVSNMPGPDAALSLAKAAVVEAYPLLPLAPDTTLVVGTLGWNGTLCLAITTGGWLEPHTEQLVHGIRKALAELGVAESQTDAPEPGTEVP